MSPEKLFYVTLWQNAENATSVRCVVDIGTREEFVDKILHLVVAEHLPLRNGSMTRHAQCQSLSQLVWRRCPAMDNLIDHIVKQLHIVHPLDACRNAIDGIAALPQPAHLPGS